MSSADSAMMVVTLSRALRAAGLPVAPDRSVVAARALAVMTPSNREELYWAMRLSFVASHEHLATFNSVFAALVDGLVDPADSRGDPNAPPPAAERGAPRTDESPRREVDGAGPSSQSPWATAAAVVDQPGRSDRETVIAAASADERLAGKNFDELEPAELADLRHLMARLALVPPPRRSRRVRRANHGHQLDVRATLRRSVRAGDYPVRLAWRKRRQRPRQLVVICDVSGSMEPYARAYLQFLQCAVGGGSAEAFVFATRLTRLTRVLRRASPHVALQRAAGAAPDWSSGTRIGEALHTFVRTYGSRGMARDAVVVIVSDGWEVGDPTTVAQAMVALKRLAYRVVWVNPHKANAQFEPLAGGMAAALPYVDAFRSGHSLDALRDVAEAIAARRQ